MSPAGFQPTIVIVDPDPAWPAEFEAEAARLREVLDGHLVRIEHHGSTSVPGLAAKPIIDIQVSLGRVDTADLERRLTPLGYAHVPWPGDADGYPFFAKPAEGSRTHHVHACVAGSDAEHRHLVLRDFLRAKPDEARAYGDMKRALASKCRGDRQCYVDGKDAYVKALVERAVAWAATVAP
jgi:GrpB-like predicted nucleotidyltransferase (UPF0157 family)